MARGERVKIRRIKVLTTDQWFTDWLNRYSVEGWQLVRAGRVTFTFAKGEPCEYSYRYEVLPGAPDSSERAEYLELLDAMGVEVIRAYESSNPRMAWAIMRRRASLGPFELQSDVGSRLAYERQVRRICWRAATWTAVFLALEAALVAFCLATVVSDSPQFLHSFFNGLAWGVGLWVPFALGLLAYLVIELTQNRKRLRRLREEQLVFE
ncbi:MAG: DUF2812 domain-containing protein [Bifidobacteriaceae bacterium]|jgi:hypothetical protein|nr:DUF2812 domain-containing protein [Bifidobacteriaceae bacterium]